MQRKEKRKTPRQGWSPYPQREVRESGIPLPICQRQCLLGSSDLQILNMLGPLQRENRHSPWRRNKPRGVKRGGIGEGGTPGNREKEGGPVDQSQNFSKNFFPSITLPQTD